ncbi:polymer-forming cytoskeletal protein [Cypionkella sp.]|uniref:bactofilin family protein n=1 Tax=Cypionkella sp. TaxID=2811411 RepID=UPI0026110381|nr:polymer-forming cytoskeletal protein [Cypionkella sp.]
MTSPTAHPAKTSVLAANLEITGDVRCTGQIVIEATIRGNVVADDVSIEATAQVEGDVEARALKIDGVVLGKVLAVELTVTAHGHVAGSLSYGTLTVHPGATVEGDLKKISPAKRDDHSSGSAMQ